MPYEIPWNELSYIGLTVLMWLIGYVCWRSGYTEGFEQGARTRRKADRAVRRLYKNYRY